MTATSLQYRRHTSGMGLNRWVVPDYLHLEINNSDSTVHTNFRESFTALNRAPGGRYWRRIPSTDDLRGRSRPRVQREHWFPSLAARTTVQCHALSLEKLVARYLEPTGGICLRRAEMKIKHTCPPHSWMMSASSDSRAVCSELVPSLLAEGTTRHEEPDPILYLGCRALR